MFDLSSIGVAIQIAKDVYASFSSVQEVKKDSALLDKLEQIQTLRHTLLDAKEEILDLREKLSSIYKIQYDESKMLFDASLGVYWIDEGGINLAYCSKCWVEHKRLVPLVDHNNGFRCSSCDRWYNKPRHSGVQQFRLTRG